MSPKSKYVNINELRLHYLEWGDDNKTVICLHGLTSNSAHWDHFSKKLSAYYRIVALDQRGHGDSEWAADSYDIEMYVSDLLAFINYLETDSVVLVGHSLGGLVTMRCASLYPDRIEKIVVVDMSPAPREDLVKDLYDWNYPLEFESVDSAVKWASSSYGWAKSDVLADDFEKRLRQRKNGQWVWKADPNTWSLGTHRTTIKNTGKYWDAFTKIKCPVLIVRGLGSDHINEETKSKMLLSNNNCEWVDIKGAGHNVLADQPEKLLKAVYPFFKILS